MRTALLDLDGTLVDPAEGILSSYRHALTAMGRPDLATQPLEWVIGPSLRSCFAELLGDADHAEAAVGHYREVYGTTGLYQARRFEGIVAALETMRASGIRLVLCTAKPQVYAARVVEHFGFTPLLDGLYGPDLAGTLDDKGDLIAHIRTKEPIDPAQTVMIGDRKFDVLAARRHDIHAIGVTWGYGSHEELTEAGASVLCERTGELAATVRSLIG